LEDEIVMVRKKIHNIIDGSNSNLSNLYNIAMMLIIILSIIPLCFKTQNAILNIIDKFCVSIFIIDYLIRWITYDLKTENSKICSYIQYPFSLFAIIDLLSILASATAINSGLRLFKIFRLFRTLRVLKILRFSKSFSIIICVLKKEKSALGAVAYMALGYIIISALIMFSVEPDTFNTFFDAIYWATTALTTVGYGDIYPVTSIGKLVSMVSSLLGIAFVALPAGVITAGFMNELNNIKK
jgi:voltage-gated potassium channel